MDIKKNVSNVYRSNGGINYHSGIPRSRLAKAENRRAKSFYMEGLLRSWLPNELESILEFGAGFGQNLWNIKANRKVAYEPSKYARNIAKESSSDIKIVSELPKSKAIYDVVLCNHSLEHVLNPRGTLISLKKLIKLNGLLILIVPFERDHKYEKNDPNHHLFSWTQLTLGNLISECGFEIIDIHLVYRSLEFRLSFLQKWSMFLYIEATKIAGRIMRSKDIFCAARKRFNDSDASTLSI